MHDRASMVQGSGLRCPPTGRRSLILRRWRPATTKLRVGRKSQPEQGRYPHLIITSSSPNPHPILILASLTSSSPHPHPILILAQSSPTPHLPLSQVPLQPDGTVSPYGGGGQLSGGAKGQEEGLPLRDVLPWWIDGRHHGWAPATPPRDDQWEDWAI